MVAPAGIEPATHGASVRCSTNWAIEPWWSRRELEPAIFSVKGRRIKPLYHWTIMVAEVGLEPMTSGLWALRDTKLLHSAIYKFVLAFSLENEWRVMRDSNPRGAVKPLAVFKTAPFNQAWVITHGGPNRIRTCNQPVMSRLL